MTTESHLAKSPMSSTSNRITWRCTWQQSTGRKINPANQIL